MADNALPDELISEILSPALRVSDEHFTQTSTATFAKYSESTSAYLVVCKSWLRVATPLLYHVVVLRSKAQATALASALAKNKDLGRFIKKLRVEGGFGQPMQTILQSAPNLTDLFLSLIIWSPDTTDGLCKGLKSVNPRTLIVHDVTDYGRAPKTKARANLVDTIVKMIPKWSNLTHFHYPLSYRPEATQKIVDALAACQRLEVLYVKDSYEVYLAFKHFSKCPLKAIHVDSTEERYHRYHTSKGSELDALLHFRPSEKRETVAADIVEPGPSLNPFFVPMQHASPTVQDAIWSCVLRHAMNCEERAATFDKWFGKPASLIGYLLVCKTFLRAGLPHFYESVNLSYGSEDAAVEILRANPPPQYPIRNFYSAASSIHPGYLNNVILSTSATLVNLFMDIGFEIPDNGDTVSLDALMQLSRLETLHLAGRVSVSVAPESMEKEVNPTALPNLRWLNLERATKSLVSVFAYFKLPSLRDINITFDRKPGYGQPTTTEQVIQTLLAAHGEKLTQLTLSATVLASFSALDLCPNLTCFSIVPAGDNTLAPSHSVFEAKSAVPSLVQIKIACTSWPYNRTKSARAISSWDDFLDAFDPREVMPNMHELVFKCFRWPTTERDIAKSQWVRWAEQLTKLEIDLVDETGKKWRSRLKVAGGRAGQR